MVRWGAAWRVKSQGFVPCSLGVPSRSMTQDETGRRELAGPCHQPTLTQRQKRLTPAQSSGTLARVTAQACPLYRHTFTRVQPQPLPAACPGL